MRPTLKLLIQGLFRALGLWAIFCTGLVAVGIVFNFSYLYEHGTAAPGDGFSALIDFFSQLIYVPLFFTASTIVRILPDQKRAINLRELASKLTALSFLMVLNFILNVISTLQNRTDYSFRSFQEFGGDPQNVSEAFHYALKFLWFADGIYPLFVPQFYGATSLLVAAILFTGAKTLESLLSLRID